MNTITGDELFKYAEQFNIKVNRQQAYKVAQYLRGKNVNIFDDRERSALIKEIAKIAGPETAREVNKLLIKFTK